MANSINQESDFTDEGDCYGTLTTGYGRIYDECDQYYDNEEYDEDYQVTFCENRSVIKKTILKDHSFLILQTVISGFLNQWPGSNRALTLAKIIWTKKFVGIKT